MLIQITANLEIGWYRVLLASAVAVGALCGSPRAKRDGEEMPPPSVHAAWMISAVMIVATLITLRGEGLACGVSTNGARWSSRAHSVGPMILVLTLSMPWTAFSRVSREMSALRAVNLPVPWIRSRRSPSLAGDMPNGLG